MSRTSLDAIDRKILKYLIGNARMPFLEIARECGISGAAIHQRIRKLQEAGVIQGSRLVVDPKTMGFDVCAYVNVTLKDPQLLTPTMEHLREGTKRHGGAAARFKRPSKVVRTVVKRCPVDSLPPVRAVAAYGV